MLDLSTYMSVDVVNTMGNREYLYVRGANSFGSVASMAGVLCVTRRLLYDAPTDSTTLKGRTNYNHLISVDKVMLGGLIHDYCRFNSI